MYYLFELIDEKRELLNSYTNFYEAVEDAEYKFKDVKEFELCENQKCIKGIRTMGLTIWRIDKKKKGTG